MGSSGSDTQVQYQPAEVDQGDLAQFMSSKEGQQYAHLYDSRNSYITDSGNSYVAIDPTEMRGNIDATPMVKAFQQWQKGNTQTQLSWDAYSRAVAANEGGQGDNTITSGAGVGQRQQLLGALANAGNPMPGAPAQGLGTFGSVPSRMRK